MAGTTADPAMTGAQVEPHREVREPVGGAQPMLRAR